MSVRSSDNGNVQPPPQGALDDIPLWARRISSEGLLFFATPLLGWFILGLAFYWITSDTKSFKLACSFLWSACAVVAITAHLSNIIFTSVANHLLGRELSIRQPFSYFYLLQKNLSSWPRLVVLSLGLGKVALLLFGAFALWGGLLIIALWLPTING